MATRQETQPDQLQDGVEQLHLQDGAQQQQPSQQEEERPSTSAPPPPPRSSSPPRPQPHAAHTHPDAPQQAPTAGTASAELSGDAAQAATSVDEAPSPARPKPVNSPTWPGAQPDAPSDARTGTAAPAGLATPMQQPANEAAATTTTPVTSPPSINVTAPPLQPRTSAPAGTSPAAGTGTPGRKPTGAGAPGRQGSLRGAPGSTAGLKMPPSLAAKMAAMTSRSSSSAPPSASPTPAASAAGGADPSSSPSPTPSNPAVRRTMQPSLPLRTPGGNAPAPSLAPRPAPRPGAAGAGGPGGQGGMAARRRGPALKLSQMGISTEEEPAAAPRSPVAQAQAEEGSTAAGAAAGKAPAGGLAAKRGLSARTGGMRLPGSSPASGGGGPGGAGGGGSGRRLAPPGKLSSMNDGQNGSGGGGEPRTPGSASGGQMGASPFSNFRKIVDPSGRLNFASKAILHSDGVDFSSGASFKIKMDEFELFEELGKGNYGTVQKVVHRPTGVTMALKEIRLELDDSKLKTIITELDILHRATSPFIVDFYGAFFIESCVYYCMEFMDAGSLDFFGGCDVPEDVLARITRSMVEGLRFLKDELKIMHRDVKPTNVLLNSKGAVKLCDFGVSGQLDRSIAKTNIGCQSYMAPERIKGESQGAPMSYTASSDVWSLGLSVIEAACGHYPYPPETYQNVFAQLTAIVHGDPPALPDQYSPTAQDFAHPFLRDDPTTNVDMRGFIERATEYRKTHPKNNAPALA
ncbi:MAP kinase kinase Wis1 [Rhodotorula sphaerocarpa]